MDEITKWSYPGSDDVISRLRNNHQALWYLDEVDTAKIKPFYTLNQLIAWANLDISEKGCTQWFIGARYPITQFVKLCRLYQDYVAGGPNVKPFLLTPRSNGFEPLTGDSRLRALELIPDPPPVSAVVVGSVDHAHKPINTLNELASTLQLEPGTSLYLRLDDSVCPALEWYEIDVPTRIPVTGPDFVKHADSDIRHYVEKQGNSFRFDRDWFCQPHAWCM